MSAHVLCVGVAVLDNIFSIERFPAEPTKTFARDFRQAGGGPAANGAVTIARLGGTATLWARLGDDAVGHAVADEIRSYGVDADTIRFVPGRRTGVSSIVIDERGERNITAFADRGLDRDAGWLPGAIPPGTDALLCDLRWPAASERIMPLGLAQGLPVVLDADLSDDDAVERLIGLATHAVFSKPALTRLAGTADTEQALRAAQARTSASVSVTLGADGFAWLDDGKLRGIPAFRVAVVDTLAAGDVFHGAFALGLAERLPIADAGRFASAAAALKCTRWGGRAGIPDRAELDRFLAQAA